MYIGPTTVYFDNYCVIVCIFPMLTTAMVECRLFAYFLLIKERLRIINQSIEFFRSNLDSFPNVELNIECQKQNSNRDKMKGIRSKVFFIAVVGSEKINERVKVKSDNGSESNFAAKSKSMMSSFWRFTRNMLNIRKNKIFVDDFEAAYKSASMKNNYDYVERVCSMQIIYTKLCETSDLISKAYGIQIIVIIAVQFITLTTLLYYCTMKIIRWEFAVIVDHR